MNHSTVLTVFLAVIILAACDSPSGPSGQAQNPPADTTGSTTEAAGPESVEVTDAEGMPLEGMFRYMADAALFRDCRTGKTFPVAMAGPYKELESAYLNSGITPGEEVRVSLRGRLLEHPKMEGNGSEIMVIVDSFDSMSDSEPCLPETDAELVNTYWKLIELQGQPVYHPGADDDTKREPHMVLAIEDSRAHGFAGCNNFFGRYHLDNDRLQFSAIGATQMACPQGMDIEQAFLSALGETNRAEVSGLFLQLYSDDTPLARFEAVYLP